MEAKQRPARRCPICNSAQLTIRQGRGFERFLISVTGKRKYRCSTCGGTFRAICGQRSA